MLPQVEPWLPAERLRREYDAIGFFLSGHPLDDYATVLKRLRVQSWAEFSRAVKTGATAGKVAATVVSRMERRTKTGNKMGIMGLSDPTGHFEAVLFSEGLAQYRDVLEPGAAVLLQLGAELQGEDVRARVLHAEPLDDAAAKTQKGLRIFQAARFHRAPPQHAGSSRFQRRAIARGPGEACTGTCGRRRRRRFPCADARSRNRGRNEAPGPFQGLATDRRRDQGGCGRGGRADAVGRASKRRACAPASRHSARCRTPLVSTLAPCRESAATVWRSAIRSFQPSEERDPFCCWDRLQSTSGSPVGLAGRKLGSEYAQVASCGGPRDRRPV